MSEYPFDWLMVSILWQLLITEFQIVSGEHSNISK